MNLSLLITSVAALIVGFAGGMFYTEPAGVLVGAEQQYTSTDELIAADFLSTRPLVATLPAEALTAQEQSDLQYMHEEEKLARDVYQTLYEQWQLPIFANIAQSEQTHTEAVRGLLEKYNIIDPVREDTVGIFTNPELQTLYTSLVAQGSQSEIEALRVGALIEELDIKDIAAALERTDNRDITLVYENLLRGSRNHLRSFSKQLVARGVGYDPQHLSVEVLQTITTSAPERGEGQGSGGIMQRGWVGR